MKNYFRIFRYANRLKILFPSYALFTILGIVFSAFNLALLIPLLDIIFDQVKEETVLAIPESKMSVDYAIYLFKSTFLGIVQEYGKERALLFVSLVIGFSVFSTNLFRYIANLISSKLRVDILKNLRMSIFSNLSRLHLGFFQNERKGDMISRVTNDVQEVEVSILNSIKSLFKEPLTVIVYFVFLFFISYKLTLYTLIVLPVMGGFLAELMKRLKKRAVQSQKSLGRIVSILDETLGGMRVIKAFNARNYVVDKIDKETSHYRKVSFSLSKKRELASPVSETVGVIIVLMILYYGGTLILNNEGDLKPSEFISYIAFFSQIISPAKAFSNGLSNLQKGLASSERIFEVIDTEPEIKNLPGAKNLDQFTDKIEYRDVTFSYGGDNVLKKINFTLEKGKTVALVGPSGGGKSTIADLLPRFYDVQDGDILIDGKSIKSYDIESFRSHMGIVTQESILFNDTVFNNIAFGMTDASEEEVIKAATIANAHDFIMELEEGYQTVVGDRGGRLSGGQRQRISIARAVMKNPAILILDEATSALDSESERLVQDALSKLMQNRTTLVIAHRLSTIQHADEILVIQSGEISERGTHDELLNEGGLYEKLSEFQNMGRDELREKS